ncbi:ATP:cob(I)alamin adenosyltransferase [Candidatus Curtissbacteria bacterium RIFCSPHIGHO2_01_FULL_41_44]|uniref:Corrinoid adenosyltransferase n=1 Tax=Candidatus Curtissbacteria bacterium RIFCSPLOWO2_01_FULL_42_50 TaxID=1797730 RepID=A0A1F5H3X2_9BACT|nr:MAG: ATP:cob(I)alamin adenosyltransferase [Candidatus Curtissbacteria bacterium RIFCSPHIGHO2_01_FULL_41_44]OGD94660.1 MAG: ATP:cob(I)alamin adenosyltransferase [Candidatus Curtissbacteria bacterium RIFCSPHIGHO2_02_FULL_42_58]OGD96856.1 MAG: ATP:cob(I)alamin adenosyltransferase [Candidatus Curtissbacteria bacterium RIFCSPHIGHO2_12_FULL_42_33]OGD98744.1 MAG: ATP:cob(I)alamin adenosyltransferase [Candidatus Curtissbacteria bacterium RIFCSPLOWO2_01_FULL_42_50]OGE02245.1 MAG: ATP:cob(I)alamin ade
MKIYTKTGDRGTTSLFGGKRVDKNSARICAYGDVDELNSLIGVILADLEGVRPQFGVEPIKKKLLRVQSELFVLGADLATPAAVKIIISRITKSYVTRLEKEIDGWNKNLPTLRNFILPRGGKIGAKLHLARAIARRAERSVVNLSTEERTNPSAQVYINRLSDWLFVAARYVNKLEKSKETTWKGRR